jgi:hypothetical protein
LKTQAFLLVTLVASLGLLTAACREPNPAYVGKTPPKDGSPQGDLGPDVRNDDGGTKDLASPADAADSPASDRPEGDEPMSSPDLPARDDADFDLPLPRDTRDVKRPTDDAPDAVTEAGPPVLDVGGGVTEAGPAADTADVPGVALDAGAEVGPVDAAPTDLPPACTENQTRPCATPGNPLLGVCQAGTQTCLGGAWGACTGEVLPKSTEVCGNGLDDNCDGMTDEGCPADCIVVAPNGDDSSADGSQANPFGTIQAALLAAVGDGGPPQRVCVAGGATCADSADYSFATSLSIPNGARVQGNYALGNAALTYCANTRPPTTTLTFTAAGASVRFGDAVSAPTEFGGFAIERFSTTSGSSGIAPATAVAVAGAKNVTLSGLFVTDSPAGDSTYGVSVGGGGQATIIGSSIGGGDGRTAAVGVYVNGGSVTLRNNCDTIAHGACASACTSDTTILGIRGKSGSTTSGGSTTDSSAVYVTSNSPSNSIIAANLLCGGTGVAPDGSQGANLATLHCENGGCASVTGNQIVAGGGRLSLAAALVNGGGILDANLLFAGCGTDGSYGLLLGGSAAHVRNNRILGGACTGDLGNASFVGMRVVLTSGAGEPDVHSNDIDPRGVPADCVSTGVLLERTLGQPSPAGAFRNNIIAAGSCRTRTAMSESNSATARLIENNDLYAEPGVASVSYTTVLFHRAAVDATTIAQVNALAGAARNISANPKYVSYPDDLHLTAASPCIDQGTEEGAPANDAEGNPRPQGDGFDIGAYELKP